MSNEQSETGLASNVSTVPLAYWCHVCQSNVNVFENLETSDFNCNTCKQPFVEKVHNQNTNNHDHPEQFLSARAHQRLHGQSQSNGTSRTNAEVQAVDANDNANENIDNDANDNVTPPRRRNALTLGSRHAMVGNDLTENLARSITTLVRGVLTSMSRETAESFGLRRDSPVTVYIHSGAQGATALSGMSGQFGDYYMGGINQLLNELMQINPGNMGPPAASEKAISALPKVKITKEDVANKCECAVCKDSFEEGFEALKMPCEHLYCPACITEWLKRHNTCPVCRKAIESVEEVKESRSDRMRRRLAALRANTTQPSGPLPAIPESETVSENVYTIEEDQDFLGIE